METTVAAKLAESRRLLQELGQSLTHLVNTSGDVFDDPEINKRLQDFRVAYDEAVERLAHPSLCIATLGTTSSGKSTIVNALMGRRIAPIEAGEMSGGVLTLYHSLERKLVIDATEGSDWETGEWQDLSDDEFYNRIQGVMRRYHEVRRKKDCIAPQIKAYLSLLPACDLELSGLPEGLGIEFLDLPGLKSVQDRTNLAIIQPQVGKAFSLVALDYLQVDEEHRQSLLSELKQVVEYLQGRTDSMIFILNRVDQRGSDDLPLEQRLQQLREEIKEVLSLPNLPDVMPFNGRLLYYAQCAWGTMALRDCSIVSDELRVRFLKALFKDCGSFIWDKVISEPELTQWFRDINDAVYKGIAPDDYKMRRIMFYVRQWSGANELWDCVRKRLQESFSELVILPALLKVFNNFDALIETLNLLIKTRQIDNQEQVKQEKTKIAELRSNIKNEAKQTNSDFESEIQQYINAIKSDDPKQHEKAKKEAKKKGRTGFSSIFDAVAEVEGDLTKSLVVPVRNAFTNNQSAYDLEDKLKAVITPPLAKDITREYDNVSRRMHKFEQKDEQFYRKVRADDEKSKKEIDRDETYCRLLFHTMREGITARAEYKLQTQLKEFDKALQSFVDEYVKRLNSHLSQQELSLIDLEQAIMSDLRKKLNQSTAKLPKELFKLTVVIDQRETSQTEVVGQRDVVENYTKTEYQSRTESYKEGSCLKTTKTRTYQQPVQVQKQRTRTEDITADIEYIELFLPGYNLMAKQWSEGITKGKNSLWDILSEWIQKRLNDVTKAFSESVEDIVDLVERSLEEQLKIIESEFEVQKLFWQEIERQEKIVSKAKKDLLDHAIE